MLTTAVARDGTAYVANGNRLLDDVLGATVHVVEDEDAAASVAAAILERDPERAVIPPGGSTPTGTMGYVRAAIELAGQLRGLDVAPSAVVCASSTGGTAAGLAVGAAMAGLQTRVEAVAVFASAAATESRISALANETAAALDLTTVGRWTIHDDQLGPGYGIETAASRAAIDRLARTEGVLLDPVYTAKAFAHVLARGGGEGEDIVFIHTGGQAALFPYA